MQKNEIDDSDNFIDSSKEPFLKKNKDINKNINEGEYTFCINENSSHETNYISTSKYTWYNVLPKILIEQFSKMANIYFLIIAIMQSIGEISISGGKPVILLPLTIVIFINGLKDFLEDRKRKKSDDVENNKTCYILNKDQKTFEIKKWQDVKIGNIVKINNHEGFPADLILINSSEVNGLCYIETKNLDGETNLKYKQSNGRILDLFFNEEELSNMTGEVKCKKPDEYIFEFDASIQLDSGELIAIDKTSFLLRGCYLKQTDYIYGLVVYVGHNTKIMKNSPSAKHKTSRIENIMNFQIIVIFCVQILLSLLGAIINIIWVNSKINELNSYIFINQNFKFNFLNFFSMFGTWILIFTNLVPISLLVTMEMIKFIQGIFISWDIEIYDIEKNQSALVQTSTLNEELGQVKYIFSDKTGTLTKNYMEFKKISIGNYSYGSSHPQKKKLHDDHGEITNANFEDEIFYKHKDDLLHKNHNNINLFIECLSLCNTVMIDSRHTEKIIYQGSSPDEIALVNGARLFGYIFKDRDINNIITLEINKKDIKYECLNILEYTSERKMMSVVVKCPDGKIRLYCKGADLVIRKLINKNKELLEYTDQHMLNFAQEGLRTLMIAYKEIPQNEYIEWNKRFIEVVNNPTKKDKLISKLFEELERDLYILGATGIEDQLQDNVSETIDILNRAGIKIWMLTGDKMDTAKSIAYSCKLLSDDNEIIEIKENSSVDQIKNILFTYMETCMNRPGKYSLIIGMDELNIILITPAFLDAFYQIVIRCNSVVCCRASPKQKAMMVNLIKERQTNITTLAIGDGANDVNMITSAHVGIGISGVEGMQASRASDYSIGQFSFLRRLLLVHGRESYRKNSLVVCYNFYKNMLFVVPQFWFGYVSYYSGQTLYDPWIYQLFNIIFSSMPIIWFGIYDKEIRYSILYIDPRYYIQGIVNKLFHSIRFWKWIIYGMIQGLIIFLISFYCNNTNDSNGYQQDLFSIGSIVYSAIVLIVNLRILLSTNTHSIFSVTIFIVTVLFYYIVLIIMSNYYKFDNFDNDHIILLNPCFYLSTILILVLALIIDIGVIRILYLFGLIKDPLSIKPESIDNHLSEGDATKLLVEKTKSKYYGAAFSGEKGQTDYIYLRTHSKRDIHK